MALYKEIQRTILDELLKETNFTEEIYQQARDTIADRQNDLKDQM